MELPQTWLARPEWVAHQEPADWLTPPELAAWKSWASETRRREWLAGRLAAKRLLREAFGLDPQACEITKSGAAPCVESLPHIALSLSHSEGLGAASWSDVRTEGTTGLDAQWIRPTRPGLCQRVFRPEEQAQIAERFGTPDDPAGMLLLWAIKEAAIKARRVPWGRPLRDLVVTLGEAETATANIAGEPPITAAYAREGGWWLAQAVRPPVGEVTR